MAQAVPKSNHKPKEHKKTSSISPAKVTKSATVGKSSKLVHAKADSVTVTADDCDDEVTTTSDCDGEETTTSDCEDSTTTSPSDCDDEPSFPSPTPTDDCDDVTSTSTDDCEEETSISDDCETSAPTSTPDCDDNFTDIDDDCDDDLPIITVTETIYKKLLKITTTKTHSTTLPFKIWAGTKTVTSTKTVTETATITETRFNATTTITRMTAQSSALQGLFQRLGLAVLTLPRPTITSPSALRAAHYGDDMHDLHKRDEMNATTELVSSQVSEAMNSSALTTASDNGALKYSPICVFSIGLAGLMVLAI
ncbi:unnamed protein product [Kuraishia capsulata CBS 1993]|uniref:Uncharacterized protein n=1 Tax=Kuraishia capsulata CBS 1993 TaxID=1382522 RepID=W6MT96_9ASCO|nr:uncharacterized protein KUCA_T00005953001 [Kuraishia capsulata CBS 1993]CDK29959.1 unnamed protein product [Kuraishia capsulata CBS 1993]